MNAPEKIISLAELKRNSGERGARKWIAHRGIVYDVSDCPKWKQAMHEQLHFPGQDLSEELEEAPHGEEVFRHPCVQAIGKLAT